jgi:RecQ-mediated genome instability protein 1
MDSQTASQIRASLQSQGLPAPTTQWIQSVLPNRNPMPPLPALAATAKARLMATDITQAGVIDLAAAGSNAGVAFPPGTATQQDVREARLPHDVLVQVLDIDNLTRSKWEQVEELEAITRGERTRGREVIRLPNGGGVGGEDEDGGFEGASAATQQQQQQQGPNARGGVGGTGAAAAAPKNSTHRLVFQDCKGQKVCGLELKRNERIGVGTTNIGEKILLRKGAVVARGTVLLDPATCTVLGGKVEAWQKVWLDNRLEKLKETVGTDSGNGSG